MLSVGLVSNDFLDVDGPLLSVDGDDLAISVFVGSLHDLDSVSLSDWDGSDVVLGSEILGQVAAHNSSSEG